MKFRKSGNNMQNQTITATLLESELLQTLVERLASRRNDIGYSSEKVQVGWKAIETSSLEAYVSGEVNFTDQGEMINMPFTTCFLFTCIKGKNEDYRLALTSSLS